MNKLIANQLIDFKARSRGRFVTLSRDDGRIFLGKIASVTDNNLVFRASTKIKGDPGHAVIPLRTLNNAFIRCKNEFKLLGTVAVA